MLLFLHWSSIIKAVKPGVREKRNPFLQIAGDTNRKRKSDGRYEFITGSGSGK